MLTMNPIRSLNQATNNPQNSTSVAKCMQIFTFLMIPDVNLVNAVKEPPIVLGAAGCDRCYSGFWAYTTYL